MNIDTNQIIPEPAHTANESTLLSQEEYANDEEVLAVGKRLIDKHRHAFEELAK